MFKGQELERGVGQVTFYEWVNTTVNERSLPRLDAYQSITTKNWPAGFCVSLHPAGQNLSISLEKSECIGQSQATPHLGSQLLDEREMVPIERVAEIERI
jgi:hypothetical protein